MTPAARERSQVRTPMLFISAGAWILLAVEPGGTALVTHCSAETLWPTPSKASLGMLVMLKPLASLALGWAVMVAAMMVPLLIAPVRHVRDSSFARRRMRAIALFVAGYAAIWMAAGVILMALALAVRLVAPESSVPLALVILIALVWQFSPAKQRCLNRGHAHSELAAFGRAADTDALRFGLTHGVWCVGSCWALMLLPLLVTRGHVAAMTAVTLWLLAERLDRPMPPGWGLRVPDKAARLAVAQIRIGCRAEGANYDETRHPINL
jgi:predicted metal-binding membrane protein